MPTMYGIDEPRSVYYPPRARWYRPFLRVGHDLRRRLQVERLEKRAGISWNKILLSLLLPGYAFGAMGRRICAWALAAVYAVGGVAFLIWMGYPGSSLAAALLISLHTTGILYLLNRLSPASNLPGRLVLGLAVVFVVSQAIYSPLRRLIQHHWAMPLREGERVIVVNPSTPPNTVQRGDWVAYRMNPVNRDYRFRFDDNSDGPGGFGLERVLAVAGDRVRFSAQHFEVNGVRHARRPHMPLKGEKVVADRHWFIWPNLRISGHGNVTEEMISARMLEQASVSEGSFIGKPYKRWFWRQQTLP